MAAMPPAVTPIHRANCEPWNSRNADVSSTAATTRYTQPYVLRLWPKIASSRFDGRAPLYRNAQIASKIRMMPPTVRAIAAKATQPLGPLSASYELVRGGAACAVVIGARPSTPESPRRPEVADNLTLRRPRGGDITQIR